MIIVSSDPCQLKSTTAQPENDVIDVGNKTGRAPGMSLEEILEEPSQKTIRRGGVSAEPITEEEIKNYKKKIVPKGLYV